MPYAGATSPEGWLLCDGTAINRTTYANLFALIGTTYGSGNGTTTFNVPDMRSRMPIGAGAGTGLTSRALAATGGAESVAIASGNLPLHQHTIAHTHGVTIASAAFTSDVPSNNTTANEGGSGTGYPNDNTTSGPSAGGSDGASDTAHTHSHNHSNSDTYYNAYHSHGVYYVTDAGSGTTRNRVSASGGSVSNGAVVSDGYHAHSVYNTSNAGSDTASTSVGHTHGLGSHSHTMANHTHTTPNHTHTMANHTHTYDHGHTGSTNTQSDSNSGNGGFANTALGLMNPFLAINYIIKY